MFLLAGKSMHVTGGAPPATYATWNPSDKSSDITLSNGNLTAIATNAGNDAVRSTIGKSSGKWYWEVKREGSTGQRCEIGIMTASGNINSYVGSDAYGYSFYGSNSASSFKLYNGGLVSYGAGIYNNDIVGIALDMDAKTIEFFVNGASQGVAYTGITAGTYYAATSLIYSLGSAQVTANFGASSLTYSPPSGYNAGLYT